MNKKDLSEGDICTKYITLAIKQSGWDIELRIREEKLFTAGRIYVKSKLHARGKQKRADYILYYKPNIPIAIIEASRELLISLPPLSEQERVVAKVEELMQTCDALEKEVVQSKTQLQHLMQSVLREAFERKEVKHA